MAALVCPPALSTLTSQVTIYGWSTKVKESNKSLIRWQYAAGRLGYGSTIRKVNDVTVFVFRFRWTTNPVPG